MIYGTAWKEERTAELVRLALAAGFTAIDTANQRKHYVEAAVGEAIAGTPREHLWLQTKFTYVRGQDYRLPYNPAAPLAEQVAQSFASSLAHLGVTYVDSYLLHGPEGPRGWSHTDRAAWGAMEELAGDGRALRIGISNVNADQLIAACDDSEIAPTVVQNRCYARTGWDREVRAVCRDRGIGYQGFSLLTANRTELGWPWVQDIATRVGATVPQLIFHFATLVGITPLTGTSSRVHMDEDLAASRIVLSAADVHALERI
jgi:diketogulonate reductase-like aldo/keto reductase